MSSALIKPPTTQPSVTQKVKDMCKESLAAPPASDVRVTEVAMPPPPQPQTLPPIGTFLTQPPRAPSTSSDVVLDLHLWGSTEFDSADEEGEKK